VTRWNERKRGPLPNEYMKLDTDMAWSGWQARHHLTQPAQAVDARAEAYAERLARALWAKHYADDAPQWEPLTGDLMGLLSQIDNMTTGLTTRALAGEKAGLVVTSEMVQTVWNVAAKSAPDDLHYRIRDKRALRRGLEAALLPASPTPDKE
jgi:hypothetical protein